MSNYISWEAAKDCSEYSRLTSAGIAPDRYADGWNDACVYIRDKLEEENPADVEPVRHGNRNIRFADEMTLCLECSVCGRRVDNIDLHYLLEAGEYGDACQRYPYCHCGAKMICATMEGGKTNDD